MLAAPERAAPIRVTVSCICTHTHTPADTFIHKLISRVDLAAAARQTVTLAPLGSARLGSGGWGGGGVTAALPWETRLLDISAAERIYSSSPLRRGEVRETKPENKR